MPPKAQRSRVVRVDPEVYQHLQARKTQLQAARQQPVRMSDVVLALILEPRSPAWRREGASPTHPAT